jgi:phosphatidylserine/phosphatidylglycerophosphate/cardiolipin synthase-like enzyme
MRPALGKVEFGGPDLPPRRLRDLLQSLVDGSPPGSRIDWATYYFRDRSLAQSLIRASDRGVRVQLAIEPHPRLAGANDAVIALLGGHGLNGGLHLYGPAPDDDGNLHAKIYVFSQPDIAWIGSFNPSGDEPEDPRVIAEIGDQDRGHNLLLGVTDRKLTSALRRHVRRLSSHSRIPLRLRPSFNLKVRSNETSLYFYPRLFTFPVERSVARLKQGDRLRGAISHLKKGELATELMEAVGRGVVVQLLVHDTDRRVPSDLVEQLAGSGIDIVRVADPNDLPMHAKFLLIERGKHREAWLGSYNFNKRSRLHNAEILMRTTDSCVVESLERRFEAIAATALMRSVGG